MRLPHFSSISLLWLSRLTTVHAAGSTSSPTCYEYHDAECSTGVRNTYHALTGGNCSKTVQPENGKPVWGTTCLTQDMVALTEVEAVTCRQTFGSVQRVSTCTPLGRRGGQDLWVYCTDFGCQDFGETCTADELEIPGQATLWDDCSTQADARATQTYSTPLLADGTCTSLPAYGASIQLTCVNDLYLQAELFHDEACTARPAFAKAPIFLSAPRDNLNSACYSFQGTIQTFALTVDQACTCGNFVPPPDTTGGDTYDPTIPRVDVIFNITVNRTHCLDGTGLEDLQRGLEIQTDAPMVSIEIGNAELITNQRTSVTFWNINLGLRFVGIPEAEATAFSANIDEAMDDGRMLEIVTTTCGGEGNVTLENHWSTVEDHVGLTISAAVLSFPRVWMGTLLLLLMGRLVL